MTGDEEASELLETFDGDGRPLGLRRRCDVHAEGLWHRAVNVIVFNADDQLLMQRRSAAKDVCPRTWDLTVAEHLKPGESFLEAAHRGLQEELSLVGLELIPVEYELRHELELPELAIFDFETQRLFFAVSDAMPAILSDEVAEVRYSALEEIVHMRERSPDGLTPWFSAWLDVVTANPLLPGTPFSQSSSTDRRPDADSM